MIIFNLENILNIFYNLIYHIKYSITSVILSRGQKSVSLKLIHFKNCGNKKREVITLDITSLLMKKAV